MLVASRWLDDTNFGESVVLLLEVGDAGAMGVIVNRPTSTTVAAALPQLPMFAGRDERLFAGGPVSATQPLFLAASSPSAADARELVADEVFLLTEQDSIALALETGAVRVLLGYAGWGPGQLEAELARSAWHLVPGSGRWVFAEDSLGLWQKLLDVIFLPTA